MDSDGTTEFELLAQWCEGSDHAGDLLLRRCFPLLYRFFINKVGDATDDLVQQTLIACVRHRDKMLDSGAFRMYLLKIARSRLYDHLRALRRRGGHVDDDFEQVSVAAAGTSNTSRYGRAQAATQVRDALRRLPVDLQLVVELHYWEEHSTAEIAALLELAQGTVKSRLRRARETLEADLHADAAALESLLGRAKPDLGTEAPGGSGIVP
ncbi:MAG: RNA polymerase sigma factor [Deltaproteobacteria bacterium]|nr:RNA polymerase sigma factor [Nannocystaceae bacterium]